MRLGRTAIVTERVELWILTRDVRAGARIRVDGRAGGVLDQVETIRVEGAGAAAVVHVRIGAGGNIVADECALERHCAATCNGNAASSLSGIAGDGTIAQRARTAGENPATLTAVGSIIAAD